MRPRGASVRSARRVIDSAAAEWVASARAISASKNGRERKVTVVSGWWASIFLRLDRISIAKGLYGRQCGADREGCPGAADRNVCPTVRVLAIDVNSIFIPKLTVIARDESQIGAE